MAFRADESADEILDSTIRYFTKGLSPDKRSEARSFILDIVDEYGPAVEAYPTWHPLVSNAKPMSACVQPSQECGYKGLDHTRFFRNAFITCPYHDGEGIRKSIENLGRNLEANIWYKEIDVDLYMPNANPILVYCDWFDIANHLPVPKEIAVPMMLEREVPCWHESELAENWETMKPYLLGQPHGARSSLFVDQEAGQQLKKVWNTIINTGMFGPIKT